MTAAVSAIPRTLLLGGLICAAAACGTETAPTQEPVTWREPASYTYTLRSSEGERALIGAFRITVRDGAVVKAVGVDELEQARRDGADTAEVEYAADGRPSRISLDWMENAIDDEARYVVSDFLGN